VDGTGDSVDMLRPDGHVAALGDIAIEQLWERGWRGIVLDLDNTCCAYHQPELAEGVGEWVAAALARGFRIVMVSNNFSERVGAAGLKLRVATVPNALKPLPFGFMRALRLLGTARSATVVIGDQVFTDVLGGKLLGLRTVLTEPIVAHDFPLTRALRFLERLVYKRTPPVPGRPIFHGKD
jgi:uncharacterized protein